MKIVSVPGTMQAVYQFWGLYRPEAQASPVNDVRVREALSLAIDRQQIIDHVHGQGGAVADAVRGVQVFERHDRPPLGGLSRTALRYDPARAKQLLAEAGHGGGFRLTFWNTALPGTPFMVQIGEAVAGFWRRSGSRWR